MDSNGLKSASDAAPVSDQALQTIVEQGFFKTPGSLHDARLACAELMFARNLIRAQTAKIVDLDQSA